MKKITYLFGGLLICSTLFAQRPIESNPFSLEGGLSLNSNANTFSAPMLKFRYFANDNIAARLGIMHSSSRDIYKVYGADSDGFPTKDSTGTQTVKNAETWISLGASYHFSQMERLSPYVSLDVLIGFGSSNEEWEDYDSPSGPAVLGGDAGDGDYLRGSNATVELAGNGFGIGLGAGFDYYFAENVFLGAELGFNLTSMQDRGGEVTVGSMTVDILPMGSNLNIANSASATLRLGWRF
jgi:outer membrane protein W